MKQYTIYLKKDPLRPNIYNSVTDSPEINHSLSKGSITIYF
jgi:hypothetical protein